MKAKDIGELGIIDIIRKNTTTYAKDKLTDDSAVLPFTKQYDLLLTTDMYFEKSDFPPFAKPEQNAQIVTALTLSDIAAMGGRPLGMVTALGLPKDMEKEYIERFASALDRTARKFGSQIVGGDVNASDIFTVCGSAIGCCERGRSLMRSNAKIGDSIGIVDYVGDASAAYYALDKGLELGRDAKSYLFRKMLEPEPQMRIGRYFSRSGLVNSCIDLNDGLERGLKEISRCSNVDMLIHEEKLPVSDHARHVAEGLGLKASDMALSVSGDLNLLATFPPHYARELSEGVEKYGKSMFVIGEVVGRGGDVYIERAGRKEKVISSAYEHFLTKEPFEDAKWDRMMI